MTRIERAELHLELAEAWLNAYSRESSRTRRIVLEHHIDIARFHIDKTHMEELRYGKAKKEDVE